MRLKDIGEDRFIELLAARNSTGHPRLIKAIGDDTSVTTSVPGRVLLATTDILIDGTHFKKSYTPPYLLGKKALSISLSDIAAMGGEPVFFLVSIAVPPDTPKAILDGIYKGLSYVARKTGTALAGGNTARTSGKMMVSTTLLGEASRGEVVYRSGARAGDGIFVTGTFGDSALGLFALKKFGKGAISNPAYKKSVLRHLDPAPRLEAGRELAKKRLATSMMDCSDGLLLDLGRLCRCGRVGAVIEEQSIPLSKEMRGFIRARGRKAGLKLALAGGEDYELIFTAEKSARDAIARLSSRLKLPITRIGTVTEGGRGVEVAGPSGEIITPKKAGFVHF